MNLPELTYYAGMIMKKNPKIRSRVFDTFDKHRENIKKGGSIPEECEKGYISIKKILDDEKI
mgnify:CR=1 FL=1|jgi:hypothetical protein